MKKNKNERCIEIKFNSAKEKLFIFVKPCVTMEIYHELLNLFDTQSNSKIYLLPTDYVESVKVVKDTRKNKKSVEKYKKGVQKRISFLKKNLGMTEEDLFGKRKEDVIPLTGAEVSKKEFMKTYTSEQIETIKKEIKIKKN